MNIIIVGGTNEVNNMETNFRAIVDKYEYSHPCAETYNTIMWPEVRKSIDGFSSVHPKDIYDNILSEIRKMNHAETFKETCSKRLVTYILTYSEHALNAAREAMIEYNNLNVIVYQLTPEKQTRTCVDEYGALDVWVDGVFDQYDTEIESILTKRSDKQK